MKRQKGQSVVEFALVIPLFLLLILGMIYGGFAYADYLQYSTAVREAARDIALQKEEKRLVLVGNLNGSSGLNYVQPLTKLYTAKFSAEIQSNPNVVLVGVELTRNVNVSILPQKLAPLQCAMPLEDASSTESAQDEDNE